MLRTESAAQNEAHSLSVTVLEIIKQKDFYAVSPRNSRMPVALYLITMTYSAVSILRMPTLRGSSSVKPMPWGKKKTFLRLKSRGKVLTS